MQSLPSTECQARHMRSLLCSPAPELSSLRVRFHSWRQPRRLPLGLLSSCLPRKWAEIRMLIAEQPWMGCNLRWPDDYTYPARIEGALQCGTPLQDEDMVHEGALVICKRLPGETQIPWKGCLTEEDQITAHCLEAEREWLASGKDLRAEARKLREERPKVPKGIPSSMRRPAVTQQERDIAMSGVRGALVVWQQECDICDNLFK